MRMAFELLDEMQEAGHYLDLYTFTQTLVACNSDKHAGLKHVIEVGNACFLHPPIVHTSPGGSDMIWRKGHEWMF